MTKNNTEFEKLMTWISEINEIPLETRRDFFAHLQKVGKIDEQAEKFIEQALKFVAHKNKQKAKVYREKIAVLESVKTQQENPAKSLAFRLANEASAWMMEKVENFKSWFRATEAKKMQVEETAEKSREISEVEALKASLN